MNWLEDILNPLIEAIDSDYCGNTHHPICQQAHEAPRAIRTKLLEAIGEDENFPSDNPIARDGLRAEIRASLGLEDRDDKA